MWFWLLVTCPPPNSIYKQIIINKKWQSTIEISHFLCLHAWPSRVNTHMVGIALKFKYIIWKFKKRKMQERLHCAWRQWCPIRSFNCRCFRFSLAAVISVQKWKWRGLGTRLTHFVLITEKKREQNVNKDTNLRELHILPLQRCFVTFFCVLVFVWQLISIVKWMHRSQIQSLSAFVYHKQHDRHHRGKSPEARKYRVNKDQSTLNIA